MLTNEQIARLIVDAYNAGRVDGHTEGYDSGYEDGDLGFTARGGADADDEEEDEEEDEDETCHCSECTGIDDEEAMYDSGYKAGWDARGEYEKPCN